MLSVAFHLLDLQAHVVFEVEEEVEVVWGEGGREGGRGDGHFDGLDKADTMVGTTVD